MLVSIRQTGQHARRGYHHVAVARSDHRAISAAPPPGPIPQLQHRDRGHRIKNCLVAQGSRHASAPQEGTVTLIEKCSGAVEFEAVATEHRSIVHISGGNVGRGDLTPDREAVSHLGSPFGRAEQMPSRPQVCGDAAEGRQEPLRMPRRFEAFHRPFALSGGLMRVLGAVVQIPRPPVLHRRHERAVGDLVAAQLVGDQHARHLPQALEQLTEEPLGRRRVSA